MSVMRTIIGSFARNGDNAATAFLRNADNLDNLVAAVRHGNVDDFLRHADDAAALAQNPLFMRTMAKLGDNLQYLDDVDNALSAGRHINADDFLRGLGVHASDDIASGLASGLSRYNQAVRAGAQHAGAVDDLLARADDALNVGKHGAARTATQAAGDSMSFLDRIVLRRGKIGMFASATAATALVTEFATGGAVSSAGAHGALAAAGALEEYSPELAQAVRDNGLAVLAFGADLYDTPRDAAVNAAAIALEENGRADAAIAVRIANTVTSPAFYVGLMATEGKEARAEAFIEKVEEDTGVDRARLEGYLREHPIQRAGAEELLGGVDLATVMPGLAGEPDPRDTVRQTVADTRRRVEDDLAGLNNLSGNALTSEFNDVVANNNLNLFSSFNMFLAVVLDMVGLDSLADQFKRAVVVDSTISQYGDRFNLTNAPELAPQAAAGGPRPDEPAFS